ncbi:hypothetical protein FHR83_008717 [Actinoplanes campanulatus]|uniref:Uncharacterized protein n=1 Tax=Actinoplanes campanulatus TaxID=113559 RepID=A0A7W5FJX8_9ACTN|nr:hypothetical protein [Actinoplanes campanulatus]MBB3100990.1 hypothetical protein [Actinoplanes campanulatus]GGN49123.1 hypothetical protein GCM10010109_86830 [Actinoplanes campanulatus]GID41808.1 hypothetical protein Aca09nite_83140 [Actinoplanes campanulatus]
MGFWGSFVIHRGEPLVWELLPEVPELHDGDLEYDQVSGGWQVTRIWASSGDLPDTFLTDLRDATGAPVLAADILDSSAAYVHAVGVRTPFWDTWLDIDGAVAYTALPSSPFDEDGNYLGADWVDPEYEAEAAATRQRMLAETLSGTAAADAAVAWAREAGLEPAPVADVEAALTTTGTFVEGQLFVVLNRLGVDTYAVPARATIAELLTGLIGHRLDGVDVVAHQPVRGEDLSHPAARDLLWRFGDHPLLISCGCRDEVELRPVTVSPDQRSAYGPAAAFMGARLTGAAPLFGKYAQAEGAVLRFGEGQGQGHLIVRAAGGDWVTTLDDSVHPGHWLS